MNGIICLNPWYSVLKDLIFALISCDWFKIEHFNRWQIKKNYSISKSIAHPELYFVISEKKWKSSLLNEANIAFDQCLLGVNSLKKKSLKK